MGKSIHRFILLSSLLLAGACGPKNLGSGTPSSLNNGVYTPLVVQPVSPNIAAYAKLPISVSGGLSPYTYLLTAGAGTVGFNSGVYSAPGAATTATILIADSRGATTSYTILVAGGSTTNPGTTVTPTNCAAIISGPYQAYYDASYSDPNYTSSPSRGLAYAKTVNLGDPTSCANWCGQNGAGFCEYSPGAGSGSSPLCIMWQKGQSLTQYQSTWATYAGACQ